MRTVNIIVMGKTGAGKSTLINAVLHEDMAPTGIGQPITHENKTYSKEMMLPTGDCIEGQYGLVSCLLSMYDTVGLEIDQRITDRTLDNIKKHINEAKNTLNTEDISIVWFCISELGKRFELYEIELIKKLSIDYEIPFIIVLTQSISRSKSVLETQIEKALPNVSLSKVLAKEYPIDDTTFLPSKGLEDLLRKSIIGYQGQKIKLLEEKIKMLSHDRAERIQAMKSDGERCIRKYISKARKIGKIPVGCIPFVHAICIKMIAELNKIAGIKGGKSFAEEIFANVVTGIIMTPFMIIPILSITIAESYIETVGIDYQKALLMVIERSSDQELKDNTLMAKRIEDELRKIKKQGGA